MRQSKPEKRKLTNFEKFQQTTDEILQDCVEIRATRKKQYGDDVFRTTARIATELGNKQYCEDDVHILFFAMKLARYKFQRRLAEEEHEGGLSPDEETMCDSIEDAMVYAALWESKRRILNGTHQKRQARHAAEDVQPGDRGKEQEGLCGSGSSVPESFQEKVLGPAD